MPNGQQTKMGRKFTSARQTLAFVAQHGRSLFLHKTILNFFYMRVPQKSRPKNGIPPRQQQTAHGAVAGRSVDGVGPRYDFWGD
jgi:hypothetical protein